MPITDAAIEAASEISWRQVNDEPFEYAIQNGPIGDEFIKLLNGTCLRRQLSAPAAGGLSEEERKTVDWLRDKVRFSKPGHEAPKLLAIIDRLAASPPAQGVAEGWKLVPVEPTREMIAKGNDTIGNEIDVENDSPEGTYHVVRTSAAFETYKAMLAASPPPLVHSRIERLSAALLAIKQTSNDGSSRALAHNALTDNKHNLQQKRN